MPDDLSAKRRTLTVTAKVHLELLMFLKFPFLLLASHEMKAFMITLEECASSVGVTDFCMGLSSTLTISSVFAGMFLNTSAFSLLSI